MDETILVVDDSPFIVEGLATILSRKGYLSVSSLGGDELPQKYSGLIIPDLILLYIMMEPMDGWETLEKIREMRFADKRDPGTYVLGKEHYACAV